MCSYVLYGSYLLREREKPNNVLRRTQTRCIVDALIIISNIKNTIFNIASRVLNVAGVQFAPDNIKF